MKYKYLFSGLLLSLPFLAAGCQDPDTLVQTDSTNVTTLTVKGRLVMDETIEYGSVIDKNNHTITVLVPYYISNTEAIQGDLTQMRLSATMPVGAKFEPSIAGIRDLQTGFQTTYIDRDGVSTPYTIKAQFAKDSLALITSFKLANYARATIKVEDPTQSGGTGTITIYKTSSAIDGVLRSAQISLVTSPWATTDLPSGTVDLSGSNKIITITSQDGTTVNKYKVVIQVPELVPSGELGYISSLFGFQTLKTETHGFTVSHNRSLAVVGDYLIVSSDDGNMIVLDRYNGSNIDKTVNITGISRKIFGITADDAQHLVAITYSNNSSLSTCEIWVWKDGLENAPTLLFSKDILTDDYFSTLRGGNQPASYDIGRTISVKGNVLSGTAVIGTTSVAKYRNVFFILKDGVPSTSTALVEFKGGTASMWYCTKPVIIEASNTPTYVWGSGNSNRLIQYVNDPDNSYIQFAVPGSWWGGDIKGLAYVEFNGTKLLGIQNGNVAGTADAYNRLVVTNIANLAANSLTTGQVFDSRLTTKIPGAGPSVTGMTSAYSFTSGGTVLGANGNHTGDVCFGKSDDGNAVQVYMLTTDHGIIAYEITRFKL